MYQEGKYSGGQTLIGPVNADLCVPIGLVLPDVYEFNLDSERDMDPCSVPEICSKKMDDLFFRVLHNKSSDQKRKTRKKKA